MKKIVLPILLILSILSFGLTYHGRNKTVKEELYSIKEYKGYIMDSDRELCFEIYSKSKTPELLSIGTSSYVLVLDSESIGLENVHFEAYELEEYYLIKLYAKMPSFSFDEVISNTSILEITTPSNAISLEYGPIAFLKATKYPLLSISNLHASYAYRNGILYLYGINLALSNSYSFMRCLRLGGQIYGTLSKAEFGCLYDTILEPEIAKGINPLKLEKSYQLGLEDASIFIPVGYKEMVLCRSSYIVVELDTTTYYIDTFSFMSNSYDPKEYKELMVLGGKKHA